MAFVQNEEVGIEWWVAELAELIAVREGLKKREANLRVLENLSEFIAYYELGLPVKKAYALFWREPNGTS